jgi:uroporphyrinogen-III decarboxylase
VEGADYTLNADGSAFCLEAYHLQINAGGDIVAVYDSSAGGVIPRADVLAGTTCSF